MLSFSLFSCAHVPVRRWIPSELVAGSDYHPVVRSAGSRATLGFGPYRLLDAKVGAPRGTNKEPTLFNGQSGLSTSHQDGWFKLASADGGQLLGYCANDGKVARQYSKKLSADEKGVRIADEITQEHQTFSYRCLVKRPGGGELRLELRSAGGAVTEGARAIRLTPLQRAAHHPKARADGSPGGYLLADEGVAVAAVDLSTKDESVLLCSDPPQSRKDELAAICMALLFRGRMI